MRPLTAIGIGLICVVLDFRTRSVDLIADPLGWALVLYGARGLRDTASTWLAAMAVPCSFVEAVLPYHWRKVETFHVLPSGEASVTEVEVLEYDPATGVRLLLLVVVTSMVGAVIVALVATLRRRGAPYGATRTTRNLTGLGGASVLAWVVPHLVGMADAAVSDHGYDLVWNDPAWSLELIGTAAVVAFAVALLLSAREPWALPPGTPLRRGGWTDRPSAA